MAAETIADSLAAGKLALRVQASPASAVMSPRRQAALARIRGSLAALEHQLSSQALRQERTADIVNIPVADQLRQIEELIIQLDNGSAPANA